MCISAVEQTASEDIRLKRVKCIGLLSWKRVCKCRYVSGIHDISLVQVSERIDYENGGMKQIGRTFLSRREGGSKHFLVLGAGGHFQGLYLVGGIAFALKLTGQVTLHAAE